MKFDTEDPSLDLHVYAVFMLKYFIVRSEGWWDRIIVGMAWWVPVLCPGVGGCRQPSYGPLICIRRLLLSGGGEGWSLVIAGVAFRYHRGIYKCINPCNIWLWLHGIILLVGVVVGNTCNMDQAWRNIRYCQTPGLGLGVDFVVAKNGQSLRNRVAEPPQPKAEPPQPEPPPNWLKWTYVD